MSTNTEGLSAISLFTRGRLAFRHFRWRRPFWAGLFTMIAGLPIAYFPYRNVTLGDLTIRMATTAGAGSLVIGVLLVVLGLTIWFQPHVRIFAGVATILLALVSLIVSNFGGFFMGFLFGLIGGAMSIAWMPGTQPAQAEGQDTGDREPPAATPGTGSALAGFEGAAPEGGKDPGKGKHRAE
ncbi:DUF6114 domain-containing protein [Streptomyces litchfieldiae]|uniref:DUF6114 domain-containing protein n=1 Tax=Streptomyces litchfieldiae TaxID=3075543 RepID=A0ABU2MIE5_9ACTN|nr:DUF6114 domain-containing protein [Streptomyces sp. DSM 44938]MDT0341373.1 DUF6114 domain-containing protein [Streptomyces sp. DSM 44938]